MNFFFGKKKNIPPPPSKAIDKLKETLITLEKREAFLEEEIMNLKSQAKECVKNDNKQKAINFLKKVKLLEKEATSISGHKFNLEVQVSALTQAVTNSETINAMRLGRETLSGLDAKLDPDKVADVMDELTENLAKIDEVADAMARPIGIVLDDDALLQELEDLSLKEHTISVPKVTELPNVPDLPSVPLTKVPSVDDELRELERVMSA